MQRDQTLKQSQSFTPTGRSKVRRLPKQGSYERDLIYEILDEGLVCRVGFVIVMSERTTASRFGQVKFR